MFHWGVILTEMHNVKFQQMRNLFFKLLNLSNLGAKW